MDEEEEATAGVVEEEEPKVDDIEESKETGSITPVVADDDDLGNSSSKRLKVENSDESVDILGSAIAEEQVQFDGIVGDDEDKFNAELIQSSADIPVTDSSAKDDNNKTEEKVGTGATAEAGAAGGEAASAAAKAKKKKLKATKDQEEVVASAKGSEKDKEFEVPLAAINKILKASLPEGAVCTKDAKSAFSKAAGIFVLYITSCANDMAKSNKRHTITAQDITNALSELGYASFTPHLEATLEKMKVEAAARKSQKEQRKKPEEESSSVAAAASSSSAAAPVN
jgi:DNA polymerase epsilon subunit 3